MAVAAALPAVLLLLLCRRCIALLYRLLRFGLFELLLLMLLLSAMFVVDEAVACCNCLLVAVAFTNVVVVEVAEIRSNSVIAS